jgi:hypothetical protein
MASPPDWNELKPSPVVWNELMTPGTFSSYRGSSSLGKLERFEVRIMDLEYF